MVQHKIVKNYLYDLTYQIIAVLAPMITIPYLSRVLGAENIGVYSYTESIVEYFTMFALLGMNGYGAREVAFHQKDRIGRSKIFAQIQILKLCTVAVATVAYVAMLVSSGKADIMRLLLGVNIIATFFDITWLYRGMEDFRTITARNILIKIMELALVFLLIKSEEDLLRYVCIKVFATLLGNLTLWFRLSFVVGLHDVGKIDLFHHFKVIMELFIPVIALRVYGVMDKTMLGYFVQDMRQSGYYEQVSKIASTVTGIVTSVTAVIMPNATVNFTEKNRDRIVEISVKTYQFVCCISCAAGFGLIAVADRFVPLFLGREFLGAISLMRLYSLVIMIIPLSNVAANTILNPTYQHNKGTIAVVLGAVVNLVLNLILMRKYMAVGATIATIVAEIVVSFVHLYFSRDYVPFHKVLRIFGGYFLCGLTMLVAAIAVGNIIANMTQLSGVVILICQSLAGAFLYVVLLLFIKKDSMIWDVVRQAKVVLQDRKNE